MNDLWGHGAGDVVIATCARRIASIDGLEAPSRFGGDEFVAIVRGDWPRVEHAARALLTQLGEPYKVAGTDVILGGSIGVARAPVDGVTASELLRRADIALYRAKELGKGRVVAFSSDLEQALRARQDVGREPRQLIDLEQPSARLN